MSGPAYDIHREQVTHPPPAGQVGRKTTDTETRVGKTEETKGDERRFRLTMGGFASRCPSPEGFVDGTFEYLLSVAEERKIGGEIRRSVDFRHFNGRLRGEVGDDARLKDIEVRGTYTASRDMPGEAPSGSSREVGPVRFAPNRGGAPDWEAMKQVVVASGDVALGNVILMGGWIYSLAELEWQKPNACVELAFEPASDTKALGANASADVKIGLRTKGSQPARAGFKAEGIRVLREGSVTPRTAEAQPGAQASVTFTAPARPRRGDGISLLALSKAGVAEDKWRIIERARYEAQFSQTDAASMGSGLGSATDLVKVTGTLLWTADDAPKPKPASGDAPSTFYKVTEGEVTVELDYAIQGHGGSSCRHHGRKSFPVASLPPAALRYMELEVAADGRYRMSLGFADRDLWRTWKMEVEATCRFPTGHVTREAVPVNQVAVEIGRHQGMLNADEGFSGELAPRRRGPRTITGNWSFTKKTD